MRGSTGVHCFDLDLHQGDGNATIFAGDPDMYTVSIHEEGIFPIPKARSNLDIGLPPRTGDNAYLARVEESLDDRGWLSRDCRGRAGLLALDLRGDENATCCFCGIWSSLWKHRTGA